MINKSENITDLIERLQLQLVESLNKRVGKIEYENKNNNSIESELKKINYNFNTFNQIMSSLLFIVIKDSTLKSLTTDEIEKISPVVNSVAKTINENINV
jgi:UDP-N-acetyl-D-mannosaminuronate dehydrogenase|tara:strand:- start:181 stop:480 length:300 start_codon:yes stop_codon:yes gene_type:complete